MIYTGELLVSNEDFPAGETVRLNATIADWQNYTVKLSAAADIAVLTPQVLQATGNVISLEFIMPSRDVNVLTDFRFEFE